MLSERLLSVFVVLAVMGITLGFAIAVEPEESRVVSADGVVTVTGVSRESQPLQIISQASARLPLANSSYKVAPDGITLDQPVVIAFALTSEQATESNLRVYSQHPSLRMWEPVSPVIAHTSETIAVETRQLGNFTLAALPVFTPPVFLDVYTDLRAQAPSAAVGYETAVGFYAADNEPVRLLESGEQGGCGGTVRVGDGEELSRLEKPVTVTIADQPVTLTFVFMTRWFMSSTGGCGPNDPLQPLSEYDILNEIHT